MGLDLRKLTFLFTLLPAMALASPPPDGAVLVVDSVGDDADPNPGDGVCTSASGCTLRAAIQEANARPGLDRITFAIGTGGQKIGITSTLPAITDPVVIDGATQPGYAGTPIVEVDGAGAKSEVDGLTIRNGGSTVRGLAIYGFSGNGIVLSGSGGSVVEGNFLGTDATGTAAVGNGDSGLLIDGSANNRIGGTTVAARNVISANQGNGTGGLMISGSAATGNVVQGNFIGTDASGLAPLGNTGRGIAIKNAPNNVIGGAVPGAGNVISGNRGSGIRIFGGAATGNVVQGNLVGTDRNGVPHYGVIGNSRGVQLRTDGNQVLGNLIAGNTIDGVILYESPSHNLVQGNVIALNITGIVDYSPGVGNRFVGNSIFGNFALGIDLATAGAPQGVTPNDSGDFDDGPNGLQNFPVLTSARRSATRTTIGGSLDSARGTAFTLEFFASPQCDSSGHGEGRFPIGQTTLTTDGGGNAAFSLALGVSVPAGWVVTATATDAEGSTSEFSACVVVQ
jgi:CSLREA domain-containing protein